ncbi:MAG TPA: hypothetical protein DD490_15365 [Acidobacteria bacterium]|nr:hypothetical protein [Acidobacteriota bacterium]
MLPFLLALLTAAPVSAPPPPLAPLRLAGAAFGQAVEIEVRDQPRDAAWAAIQTALAEVAEMEKLCDPDASPEGRPGSIAALNARAGGGAVAVDPRLMPALKRGLEVCFWSERAHGPLARDLYRLWGLRAPATARPGADREAMQAALNAASCRNLSIDLQAGTATLAAGGAVDLWGFVEGLAVDRAVDVLQQRGVANGFVQIGGVYRGFGQGLDQRGWHVLLPVLPGMTQPMARVFLHGQALGLASVADRPLRVETAGEALPPYLNQRTARPAQGTVAAAVVTELALDAQALAVTLFIAGPGEGQYRLGSLTPRPSVLWLSGSGSGEPLAIEYRWGMVAKK